MRLRNTASHEAMSNLVSVLGEAYREADAVLHQYAFQDADVEWWDARLRERLARIPAALEKWTAVRASPSWLRPWLILWNLARGWRSGLKP